MKIRAVVFIILLLATSKAFSVLESQEKSSGSTAVNIESLFSISMNRKVTDTSVLYVVTIKTDTEKISVGTTAVVAHVKDSLGGSRLYTLKPVDNNSNTKQAVWQLNVPAEKQARYVINVRVNSEDHTGARISEALPSQFFTYPADGDPIVYAKDDELTKLREEISRQVTETSNEYKERTDIENPQGNINNNDASVINVSMVNEDNKPQSAEASTSWVLLGGAVAGIVALLALLFFGYRRFVTKRNDGVTNETEGENSSEEELETGEKEQEKKEQEKNSAESTDESEEAESSIDISDDDPMSELDAAFEMEADTEVKVEEDFEIEIETEGKVEDESTDEKGGESTS